MTEPRGMTGPASGRSRLGTLTIDWRDDVGCAGALDCLPRLPPSSSEPVLTWRVRHLDERAPLVGTVVARFGALEARATDAGLRLDGPETSVSIAPGHVSVGVAACGREQRVAAAVALALGARAHGWHHVHAAAVEHRGRAWLVAGASGAGKTTVALALLATSSARWLSDDSVVVGRVDGELRVVGLPRAFHATPTTLASFPTLRAGATVWDGPLEKRVVDPLVSFPARQSHGAPPGVLVFPMIGAGPTRVRRLTHADAFAMLLEPAALSLVEGVPGNAEHLEALGALASTCASVVLELGPDALARPRTIAETLLEVEDETV